jgi:hypothetical protein
MTLSLSLCHRLQSYPLRSILTLSFHIKRSLTSRSFIRDVMISLQCHNTKYIILFDNCITTVLRPFRLTVLSSEKALGWAHAF